MNPRQRHHLVILSIVLVVLTSSLIAVPGSALAVADTSDAELSAPGSIDTPTRTVTIDGSEYEVSSLAHVEHGSPLSIDVSAPAGTEFDVDLYNADERVELTADGAGSERVTFDTAAVEPGSYAVTLYIDGNYVDYLPVVVGGYDVSADHPTTVDAIDNSVAVDVTAQATAADTAPSGVEVAVWNGDTVVRESATHREEATYRATVPVSELTAGETYAIYAVAQGDDQVEGESEVLGVSSRGTLEVTTDEEDGSNEKGGTSGDDTSGGTAGDDSDAGTPNESAPSNESAIDNETADGNESPAGEPNEGSSSSDDLNDTTSESNEDNETDTGSDEVLEPTAADDDEATSDDSDAVPVGAVPLLMAGFVLVGLSLRAGRD